MAHSSIFWFTSPSVQYFILIAPFLVDDTCLGLEGACLHSDHHIEVPVHAERSICRTWPFCSTSSDWEIIECCTGWGRGLHRHVKDGGGKPCSINNSNHTPYSTVCSHL